MDFGKTKVAPAVSKEAVSEEANMEMEASPHGANDSIGAAPLPSIGIDVDEDDAGDRTRRTRDAQEADTSSGESGLEDSPSFNLGRRAADLNSVPELTLDHHDAETTGAEDDSQEDAFVKHQLIEIDSEEEKEEEEEEEELEERSDDDSNSL